MKPKFTTSWDTYHRILWDPQFNERVFVIGYFDRVSADGIREKPVIEWSSSDIPWNRVRYIACGSIVVWDREKRLDLFETGDLPAAAYNQKTPQAIIKQAATFLPKPVHTKKGEKWGFLHNPVIDKTLAELKVATYNLLSDEYKVDFVTAKERVPAILQELKATGADILVLQEVTVPILKQLMDAPFLQDWYLSDIPNRAHFHTHRAVILSKYAFELEAFDYSGTKHFQVASWQFNGEYFHLAAVHLSSNRADNSAVIRARQLDILIAYLKTLSGDFVIAGDFNMRGEEEGVSQLKSNQLIDVWKQLRPKELGYTFDTSKNKIAAFFSLSGQPARFDRFVMNTGKSWKATEIEIFGNKALKGYRSVFPSDHFGLRMHLDFQNKVQNTEEIQPTYQSAIVVIPEEKAWPPIQDLRKKHDSKFKRWMPHITLVYGFWPDEYFEKAAIQISETVKDHKAFSIELKEYGFFAHRSSTTAWLRPISEKLPALQADLQELFPNCKEQTDRPAGFTPHLSLGQFDSKTTAQKLLPAWKTLDFKVGSIALISRVGDTPFQVQCTIELETGKVSFTNKKRATNYELDVILNELSPTINPAQMEERQFAKELLEEACAAVIGFPMELQALGSSRLDTASPNSDMDLVCLVPKGMEKETFFEQVQEKLRGLATKSTLALDASTPVLRLEIEGVSIDLLCARHAAFPTPAEAIAEDDRNQFDEASWRAFAGVLEADNMMKLVAKKVSLTVFRKLVRTVRVWAKCHGLKGNGWGYLGNYSWTVLAAWSCLQLDGNKTYSLDLLLRNFFRKLVLHNWKEPIALTVESSSCKLRSAQDRMPIITTVKPFFNSARNITRSTSAVLQNAFNEANAAMNLIAQGKKGWYFLFEKQGLPTANMLKLQLTEDDAWSLEQASGWFEGNIVGLLVGLEKELNAFVYPLWDNGFVSESGEIRLSLTLPPGHDAQRLEWLMADFTGRFEEENASGISWIC